MLAKACGVLEFDQTQPFRLTAKWAAALFMTLGCRPVRRHVLADGEKIRHDPGRLAAALIGTGTHHLRRGEHEVHSYSEVHHARQGMWRP